MSLVSSRPTTTPAHRPITQTSAAPAPAQADAVQGEGDSGSKPNPAGSRSSDLPKPPVPERLGVLPWVDPERDDQGHDPRSAYVETFWLPIIGPSTTLLLRRLSDEFDAAPAGFEIDCTTLSREIGLSARLDRSGAFSRTLDRCNKFNLIQIDGHVLLVRRRIPPLSHRQVQRLSERLQVLHHTWTIPPEDDGAERRTELVRATHLARTLLAMGESTHETEKQLHRWHFHPSIAWHAVQWAQTDPDQLPM